VGDVEPEVFFEESIAAKNSDANVEESNNGNSNVEVWC
jgi:hypothetical protein